MEKVFGIFVTVVVFLFFGWYICMRVKFAVLLLPYTAAVVGIAGVIYLIQKFFKERGPRREV